MASFAGRLKELRRSKNLTQKKMASILNITERGYQNYEIGKSTPNYETLLTLADYFKVSLDYLTGRENYWQDSDENVKIKTPELEKKLD